MLDPSPVAVERVLVLEPGRSERHYWRDLWDYRELLVILGLARRCDPLQADGYRNCLGCHSPFPDDGDFHGRVRPYR